MIKKREKLKLTQYIQIYRNNDLLLQNLVKLIITEFSKTTHLPPEIIRKF